MFHAAVKVKQFFIFLLLCVLSDVASSQTAPFLDAMEFWYNADSSQLVSGTNALELVDITGNNNATENSANLQAVMDSVPGIGKVFGFDGSTRYTTNADNVGTVCAIIKLEDNSTTTRLYNRNAQLNGVFFTPGNVRINYNGEGSGGQILVAEDFENWLILIATGEVSFDNYLLLNGEVHNLPSDAGFASGSIRIGNPGDAFIGYLKDLIFYDVPLELSQAEELSSFFYDRYSADLDLGEDMYLENFCPLKLGVSPRYETWSWSNGQEGDSLLITESGKYWVDAYDVFGRHFSDTIHVQYPGHFIPDFSLCSNEDRLWDLELGEDFTFTWQDGSTEGEYLITQAGTYQVTVEDNAGCSYTHQVEVTLDDFPHTVDIAEPSPFCLGNDLHLSGGFDEAQLYFWSTGSTAPFITPQESGTYWVEVSNQNNCIGRDTVEVDIVGEAPEVVFSTGPVCIDNPVTFQDDTQPEAGTTPVAWTWFLGNDTLHTQTAQTTYTQTGPVPVALTLTLDNGCTGTARDTILVNPLPEVNFSAPILCAGNEAFFESFATVPEGEILDLRWNFGNNTTDQGVIGSTVFQNLGDNTVTLVATSTAGCVDSLTRTVEVLGSPIADFEFQNVCIGQTMAFNELVDTQESGPVFYRWSFGDGYFSNFPNTGHQYAAPGAYEVTLTATGNNLGANGCKDTITKTVIVFPPPTAAAAANDTCFGTPLTLVDLTPPKVVADTPDPVVNRLWTLTQSPSGGGGVLGEDSLLTWLPELPGAHAIRLEVHTAAGCQAHKVTNLSILPAPHADFNLDLPVQAPPITVHPENLSQGATQHAWFLNGQPAAVGHNPQITFPDTGLYTLSLVASNELLCADTVSKHFRVIIPRYDIVLGELYPQVQNGRLRIQAALYNAGNTPVHTFDARAQVGHNPEVAFTQNASIPPGNTVLHEFTTAFEWRAADLPYVCLWVGNPDGIDQNPDAPAEADITNNYRCAALPVSEPIISDPRPNPATHEVHLSVVLPRAATAALDLIDPSGRTIRSSRQPLPEGYSPFTMDVSNLQPGMYLLRLEIGEEVIVRRIVVK